MTISERVQNGISLLNSYDKEWFKHIDLESLDIRDSNNCILGQLFGSYDAGLQYFDLYDLRYGIVIKRSYYGFTQNIDPIYMDELTAEWKHQILGLRNE